MQGAGEGRELSITFQTSGKAVRLGAPEKWRKAVAAEDLKPDTWVEIVRQGASPQTVRAGDVPELRALFVEQGRLSPAAPDEIAVEVLQLCDGVRNVTAMIDLLAEKYAAERSAIANDVIAMLQDLADKGFLTEAREKTS